MTDKFYCEHCEVFLTSDELYYHVLICDNFSKLSEEEYKRGTEDSEEVSLE